MYSAQNCHHFLGSFRRAPKTEMRHSTKRVPRPSTGVPMRNLVGPAPLIPFFELSSGLAWRYLPVVATEAWPKVACTRWIGAPRSRAWEAWACRSQWGKTGTSTPARTAAPWTIRCTWEGCRWPLPLREGNTGVSIPASQPMPGSTSRLPMPTQATTAPRWKRSGNFGGMIRRKRNGFHTSSRL